MCLTYRQHKADDTQTQETCAHLRHGAVVDLVRVSIDGESGLVASTHLFTIAQSSQEESHAEDEEQIRQDGAKQGCLDDSNLILHMSGLGAWRQHGYRRCFIPLPRRCCGKRLRGLGQRYVFINAKCSVGRQDTGRHGSIGEAIRQSLWPFSSIYKDGQVGQDLHANQIELEGVIAWHGKQEQE